MRRQWTDRGIEYTSFSAGSSWSNKKLYIFLKLQANEIDQSVKHTKLENDT
jgi:hypothetical protein